jgi:class 3 adenylate cyclase
MAENKNSDDSADPAAVSKPAAISASDKEPPAEKSAPSEAKPAVDRSTAHRTRRIDLADVDISDAASKSLRNTLRHILGDASPLNLRVHRDVGDRYVIIDNKWRTIADAGADAWLHRLDLEPQITEFEAELAKLRREVDEKAKALLSEKAGTKKKEGQIEQLEGDLRALGEKQRLAHLLTRVGEPAQKQLLESDQFRSEFNEDIPRSAYVLSIDILRSTELMLKAREPKLFAQFMITLATRLRQVVLDNYGIFDKFTGDGVLAFFPEFYSGLDAGYLSLKAASECHGVFDAVYKAHRHCFSSILKETGLGIGLDYGVVQLVQIGGDFTVVGTPVVYACRMSGATPGSTFVNEPAFERLFQEFSEYCDFEETELDIKHEGRTLAHRVRLNGKVYQFRIPQWLAGPAA